MYAIEVAEAAHHSKAELRSLRGSASCQAANERSREAANQLQMLQVGSDRFGARWIHIPNLNLPYEL